MPSCRSAKSNRGAILCRNAGAGGGSLAGMREATHSAIIAPAARNSRIRTTDELCLDPVRAHRPDRRGRARGSAGIREASSPGRAGALVDRVPEELLSGIVDCLSAALVHCRTVQDSQLVDASHAGGRRLHFGEQIRLRDTAADHRKEDGSDRRTEARRCNRVPLSG